MPAAFPHGFGLSYTTFAIPAATVDAVGEHEVTLTVQVANTGERDGGHVVQVYGRARTGAYAGESMLVGFAPVFAGGCDGVGTGAGVAHALGRVGPRPPAAGPSLDLRCRVGGRSACARSRRPEPATRAALTRLPGSASASRCGADRFERMVAVTFMAA